MPRFYLLTYLLTQRTTPDAGQTTDRQTKDDGISGPNGRPKTSEFIRTPTRNTSTFTGLHFLRVCGN